MTLEAIFPKFSYSFSEHTLIPNLEGGHSAGYAASLRYRKPFT
jgi:hypothetical protein